MTNTTPAAAAALAARRAASFDVWPANSRTRALWGAVSVQISVEMLWTSSVFAQGAEWPRRRASRGSGDRRAGSGTTTVCRAGGQAMADFVRNSSHPTDACRSVGAERNRGSLLRSSYSHPLCPCGRRRHCSRGVPLVSGTSAAPCGCLPCWSAGSAGDRGVSLGNPRSARSDALAGFSPIAAGGSLSPPLAAAPRCLKWRGEPFDAGEPAGHVPQRARGTGAHPTRSRRGVKRAALSRPMVCVAGVTAGMCAFRSKGQPPRWGQASARTLPQRGGVTRNRGGRVVSQGVPRGRGPRTCRRDRNRAPRRWWRGRRLSTAW